MIKVQGSMTYLNLKKIKSYDYNQTFSHWRKSAIWIKRYDHDFKKLWYVVVGSFWFFIKILAF